MEPLKQLHPLGSAFPPDENECGNQISGIDRDESSAELRSFIWRIPEYTRKFDLYYYVWQDLYKTFNHFGELIEKKNHWEKGLIECDSIFRKKENDWNYVYLARNPDRNFGKIAWAIEIPHNKLVDVFKFSAITAIFQTGNIEWSVIGYTDGYPIKLEVLDDKAFETSDLKYAKKIIVSAELTGGHGNEAWQAAQLFRQGLSNQNDHSLLITLTLRHKYGNKNFLE